MQLVVEVYRGEEEVMYGSSSNGGGGDGGRGERRRRLQLQKLKQQQKTEEQEEGEQKGGEGDTGPTPLYVKSLLYMLVVLVVYLPVPTTL